MKGTENCFLRMIRVPTTGGNCLEEIDMLNGKTVILGVTGSIAAYKAAILASMLKKQSCDVQVIMTQNATQFINPITFESLTGNKCLIDTFDRNFEFKVEHVAIAKKADLAVIAPASANVIAKMAVGIADDMLTTTILACKCKKLLAPAMNTYMFENEIVQNNLNILTKYNYEIIQPASGRLACGDIGAGKMQEPEVILEAIIRELAFKKDMTGKKVLVTAGPTREAIDPVRYVTNHSTGKMGYAIARAAMLRGAEVTLITGETALSKPDYMRIIPVTSAKDMFQAVLEQYENQDIILKSAAVADYTPMIVSDNKIKKSEEDITIPMKRTTDILKYLGEHKKPGQFICGFSMETEHVLENSRKKLESKNVDLIVANSLKEEGAGFGTDTNIITLITREDEKELPLMSKEKAAHEILNTIMENSGKQL